MPTQRGEQRHGSSLYRSCSFPTYAGLCVHDNCLISSVTGAVRSNLTQLGLKQHILLSESEISTPSQQIWLINARKLSAVVVLLIAATIHLIRMCAWVPELYCFVENSKIYVEELKSGQSPKWAELAWSGRSQAARVGVRFLFHFPLYARVSVLVCVDRTVEGHPQSSSRSTVRLHSPTKWPLPKVL